MDETCTQLLANCIDTCDQRAVWVRTRQSDGVRELFCSRHARQRGLVSRMGYGLHGAVRLSELLLTDALEASGAGSSVPTWLRWRSHGCQVLAQVGSEPSELDSVIGTMTLREVAEEAVNAHNAALESAQRERS